MLGCALCLLTACATPPVRVEAAKPVVVTRTQYVALDSRLTQPCAAATPRAQALQTNGSLLAAYLHDSTALTECAAQVQAIRVVQPKTRVNENASP